LIDEYYSKLVADPVWFLIWTVFSSSVGFIAGHWLALSRDRRIEFNQASEIFFPIISQEHSNPSPHFDITSEAQVFRRHIPARQLARFDDIFSRYQSARKKWKIHDNTGSAYYEDDTEIRSILGELLAFTKRR